MSSGGDLIVDHETIRVVSIGKEIMTYGDATTDIGHDLVFH